MNNKKTNLKGRLFKRRKKSGEKKRERNAFGLLMHQNLFGGLAQDTCTAHLNVDPR